MCPCNSPSPSCPPQDQVSKDKALQSMASMSSAQIVSASVLQNKLSPPPPLPQAVFSAAPRVRTAPVWGHPGGTRGIPIHQLHSGERFTSPLALVAMQGGFGDSPWFAACGEGEFRRCQKPLTLPCAVLTVLEWPYPRTAWTLSGVSTRPLPCVGQTPALARAGATQASLT